MTRRDIGGKEVVSRSHHTNQVWNTNVTLTLEGRSRSEEDPGVRPEYGESRKSRDTKRNPETTLRARGHESLTNKDIDPISK